MGNQESSERKTPSGKPSIPKEELEILEKLFKDLSLRSPQQPETMDKKTFLAFFNVPGLLGERLFDHFDKKADGVIHRDEFVNGLSAYLYATRDERIRILFEMFDMTHDNEVSKEELLTMLHSIAALSDIASPDHADPRFEKTKEHSKKTVTEMVDLAFQTCDISRDGKLQFSEFRKWMLENTELAEVLEQLFSNHFWADPRVDGLRPNKDDDRVHVAEILGAGVPDFATSGTMYMRQGSLIRRWKSNFYLLRRDKLFWYHRRTDSFPKGVLFLEECQIYSHLQQRPPPGTKPDKPASAATVIGTEKEKDGKVNETRSTSEVSSSESESAATRKEGKAGGPPSKRHNTFHGHRPSFLTAPGALAAARKNSTAGVLGDKYGKDGYFGLDVVQPSGEFVTLFVRNRDDRDEWIKQLRAAAHAYPITDFYNLGKAIGHGSYATIYEATHKVTGKKYAVKKVEKGKLLNDDAEREALRIELAIMKMCTHPWIIKLKAVFEDAKALYVVMPHIGGGDMLDRLLKRKVLSEDKARVVLWKLLAAIKFLHSRSVVHRDLKPENLLLTDPDDDTSILVTDFGLSDFIREEEKLEMQCGSLNYVAPEVLTREGYSKAVDIWSIGVMMYIFLKGEFPFHGKTNDDVIRSTLNHQVDFTVKAWAKWHTSAECLDLMSRLLDKSSSKRISVEDALMHVWFDPIRKKMDEEESKVMNSMLDELREQHGLNDLSVGAALPVVSTQATRSSFSGGSSNPNSARSSPVASPSSSFSSMTPSSSGTTLHTDGTTSSSARRTSVPELKLPTGGVRKASVPDLAIDLKQNTLHVPGDVPLKPAPPAAASTASPPTSPSRK